MGWIQALWPSYHVEVRRMTFVLSKLAGDDRVGKLFLEPHLKRVLIPSNEKVRFQGCRAARHDDHLHLQLR